MMGQKVILVKTYVALRLVHFLAPLMVAIPVKSKINQKNAEKERETLSPSKKRERERDTRRREPLIQAIPQIQTAEFGP